LIRLTFHKLLARLGAFSAILATAGVLLNNPLHWWGFIAILSFILLQPLIEVPREIHVTRQISRQVNYVGQNCRVDVEIQVNKGIGPVVVADNLPEVCRLQEGSNFKLFWKGFLPLKTNYSYTITFPRTGKYYLGKFLWKSWDALGIRVGHTGETEEHQEIEVNPRLVPIKKMRNFVTYSRIPFPAGAKTAYGVPTLEIKDIRQYQYGDPHKFINWKATARNMYNVPIVNEFEREGKKTAWIFLDHSDNLQFGTSINDGREYALEAVNSMVSFFLQHNMKVGFCTFGWSSHLIYPASGYQQQWRIMRTLLDLNFLQTTKEAWKKEGAKKTQISLKKVLLKYKKYFLMQEPVNVIVSRAFPHNVYKFSEGIDEMIKFSHIPHGKPPLIFVNIAGHKLAAQDETEMLAGELLKARDRNNLQTLRRKVNWVEWDPTEMQFYKALKNMEVT